MYRQLIDKKKDSNGLITSKSQNLSETLGESEEIMEKIPSPTEAQFSAEELPDENKIGHLLSVNCGHNNNLNYPELNQYEKHLINANIISR